MLAFILMVLGIVAVVLLIIALLRANALLASKQLETACSFCGEAGGTTLHEIPTGEQIWAHPDCFDDAYNWRKHLHTLGLDLPNQGADDE
jgi:hypothetical protein